MKKKSHLKSQILYGTGIALILCLAGIGFYSGSTETKTVESEQNQTVSLSDDKIVSTDLVLYENGRGFVSQTRRVRLKKGVQEINFGDVPQTLILSSAAVSGKDIVFQSMNFDPHWDRKTYYEIAQEEAIGKDVTLLWTVWKDGVKSETKQQAKLLGVDKFKEPILLIDGLVHKGTDARILYPALQKEIKHKNNALDFTIISQTDKEQDITFSYMAEGFKWNTSYNIYLAEDQNQMTLKGYVQLKNESHIDYSNAHIDFVLGEIHTLSEKLPLIEDKAICQINNQSGIKLSSDPITVNGRELKSGYGRYGLHETGTMSLYDGELIGRIDSNGSLLYRKAADVLDLKDYYVYRLPFQINLKQEQPVTALFLDKPSLSYQKEYEFDSPIQFYRTTEISNVTPNLNIVFQNDVDAGVGMPLPKGTVHVYNQKDNNAFFVGESALNKTISLGQRAVISIGEALDVYADIKQTAKKEISDEKKEYTYQITIHNVSNESKKIHFKQTLNEDYLYIESDVQPTENLPHRVSWTFDIPASGTKTFSCTVQYTDNDLINKKHETELEKEKLAAEEARLAAEKEYHRLKLLR